MNDGHAGSPPTEPRAAAGLGVRIEIPGGGPFGIVGPGKMYAVGAGRLRATATARFTASTPLDGITKPTSPRRAGSPIEVKLPSIDMRSLFGKKRARVAPQRRTLLPWS